MFFVQKNKKKILQCFPLKKNKKKSKIPLLFSLENWKTNLTSKLMELFLNPYYIFSEDIYQKSVLTDWKIYIWPASNFSVKKLGCTQQAQKTTFLKFFICRLQKKNYVPFVWTSCEIFFVFKNFIDVSFDSPGAIFCNMAPEKI